ncbi:hypothetical protein D9M72_584090 [compost metagenome]
MAVLPSDEVAVTWSAIVGSVSALSVPIAERVMTPFPSMTKRGSSRLYATVEPASGSLAEAVMPIRVPAAAFWSILSAVGSLSAGLRKAIGS